MSSIRTAHSASFHCATSPAQALARQTNAIIVVTGEVDYITDGQRTRTVTGGDPLMTRVTGTGCALSSVVAAFVAGCEDIDRLDAVASACAANVLAVLIPCHRVVRRDGSPSGYRWGLARKQTLLAREALR